MLGAIIGSVLFFIIGFSLSFGPSVGNAGVIGNLDYAFLVAVPLDNCLPTLAPTIPGTNVILIDDNLLNSPAGIMFAAFEMMFALMTPGNFTVLSI